VRCRQFRSNEGAIDYTRYRGLIEMNETVGAALKSGSGTRFEDQYLRVALRFETGDERHKVLKFRLRDRLAAREGDVMSRISRERLEQVRAVLHRAAEMVDAAAPLALRRLSVTSEAIDTLGDAWRCVVEALSEGGFPAGRLPSITDLLDAIRTAENGVRDDQVAGALATLVPVQSALAELRDVRGLAELMERAPLAATTLGFDRVLLSRIEESVWVPNSIHAVRDSQLANDIVQAGRERLRTIDNSLLEIHIVRRNRPLVVADTADQPNLHRAMIDTARTHSYVATPITGSQQVIGFLHADCHDRHRRLDSTDRDLLWSFSDGLSHIISRVAAIEELDGMRAQLGRLAGHAADVVAAPAWPVPGPTRVPVIGIRTSAVRVPQPGAGLADRSPNESALTRREVDVMLLMGEGRTNSQIARRLVISEGTAKSHVKSILRKLQATNRAEAVARWLRAQHMRQAT
jgi:DNA-binding CsgD family transcriptional regulator